jgi:serine phosphatase RsbU (regulator of sigma subunit)
MAPGPGADDGWVFDGPTRDEQFGLARLQESIRSARDLSQAIIAQLHAPVVKFAGGTAQQDDLTAVVVKRQA